MTTTDRITPDLILDARGRTCPGPVIEAKRAVDSMPRGGILKLVSDCPGTEADLRAWTLSTGRELIEVEPLDGGHSAYYLRNGDPWAAARVLDMRGRPCPAPVVEAGKALSSMPKGSTLKLLSDCRGFSDDLATWSRRTGHRVLGTVAGPAGSAVSYIEG